MLRFRQILAAGAASIGLSCAAQAANITTATQTLTFGPQRTEFGGLSQAFNYFDSNLGTLLSVNIGTSYGFTSQITVSNNAATSSSGTAQAEGLLSLSAQNAGVNNVLQNLLNTPVDPAFNGGISATTFDLLGTRRGYGLAPGASSILQSDATTQVRQPITDTTGNDLLPFEVAGGGTTNVIANTFTTTLQSNNGGNTSTVEATTATATFSISYTYDNSTAQPPPNPVPEPASLALLASGLFGVGMIRRRGK
jgi:hypothetical protein